MSPTDECPESSTVTCGRPPELGRTPGHTLSDGTDGLREFIQARMPRLRPHQRSQQLWETGFRHRGFPCTAASRTTGV